MMERKKRCLFQLAVALGIALLLLLVPQAVQAQEQAQASTSYVTMHRLYNPYSGEHLYTKDSNEVSVLTKIGWKKEGEAWKAATSGTPVYRLYNPNNGDHHYTLDKNEYNTLGRIGWRKEGVAWYSDSNKGVAVYRLFNPSQKGAGSHHYTTDKNEYKVLKTKGWNQEGISWYGAKAGSSTGTTTTTVPKTDGSTTTTPKTDTTTTTTPKPQAKYSYELYTTASTVYSGYGIPIFIKTDNPEYHSNGIDTFNLTTDELMIFYNSSIYDDIQYLDDGSYEDDKGNKITTRYCKVEGGYFAKISFEEPGTYSLSVTEHINGEVEGLGKVSIKVVDSDKLADEWQYAVIDQTTTTDMDPFEKMEAISKYLLNDFKYLKNNDDGYVYLISDSGLPYFVKKEWDSCTSPRVLCEIAEKVGGFDEIHNCYTDYTRGTSEWKAYHAKARLTIGDETRYFSACPLSSTNKITNITKINLIQSNLLRKL